MPLRRAQFCAAILCAVATGCALPTIRDQEIAECRPGDIATWGDGQDHPAQTRSLQFTYRHDGAPAWFNKSEVEGLISTAAQKWSECGIQAVLVGPDTAPGSLKSTIPILWDEAGSMGNFGLANYRDRTLALGPNAFALLNKRNPRYDAKETLQLVISHEMGHFLGLQAHSRRCVDVLSYYTFGNERCFTRNPAGIAGEIEYRSALPTACDIQRCRLVNDRANP